VQVLTFLGRSTFLFFAEEVIISRNRPDLGTSESEDVEDDPDEDEEEVKLLRRERERCFLFRDFLFFDRL
jgi:hypothetical protein